MAVMPHDSHLLGEPVPTPLAETPCRRFSSTYWLGVRIYKLMLPVDAIRFEFMVNHVIKLSCLMFPEGIVDTISKPVIHRPAVWVYLVFDVSCSSLLSFWIIEFFLFFLLCPSSGMLKTSKTGSLFVFKCTEEVYLLSWVRLKLECQAMDKAL